MNLISASRRTDIPHYFAKWFAERRKAGFAEFRNAFGGKGRVSLRNEEVLGTYSGQNMPIPSKINSKLYETMEFLMSFNTQ